MASFCVDAMLEINEFRFCKPLTTILGEDLASGENYRPQSHYWQSGTSCSLQFCFENCTAAGADARIWPTQFGFRTGRRCADALFVARRLLEGTCPAKHGSLLFLARRFGIQTVLAPLYVQYTVVASLWCEMLDIRPNQSRSILAYHMDVHYHLSCSQS